LAIATVIFIYSGLPQVKISQKVFFLGGGANFLTHTVDTIRKYVTCAQMYWHESVVNCYLLEDYRNSW